MLIIQKIKMNISKNIKRYTSVHDVKLIAFILFFLTIATFSLQASTDKMNLSQTEQNLNIGQEKAYAFEITSDFIASWTVKEIRNHAVIEVIVTHDFKIAHEVTEELRKFVNEPIMVKHGFENNAITYEIIIGRFSNVDEAVEYHNKLR